MTSFQAITAMLSPHVVAVALCCARLVPVAFLCPILGGSAAPTTVRLSVALSLSLGIHFAGGVNAPVTDGAFGLVALGLREVVLGMTIGLMASLPFDAARIGGRFMDLFRGSSAEAALPASGTREAATGDGLYQLLVALVATGGAFPVVLGGIVHSFKLLPLGRLAVSESAAIEIAHLVGVTLATALAIGAPIAGGCLLVDWLLGLLNRAAPGLQVSELSAPLRILGGGAVLWLGIGVFAERLLHNVFAEQRAMDALLGVLK